MTQQEFENHLLNGELIYIGLSNHYVKLDENAEIISCYEEKWKLKNINFSVCKLVKDIPEIAYLAAILETLFNGKEITNGVNTISYNLKLQLLYLDDVCLSIERYNVFYFIDDRFEDTLHPKFYPKI